jgi:catechol 2,3-dioxygenase-like lactoylglutathione lyase family enzyme
MSKSAVQFATDRRIHISLAVSSMDRSKPFYRALFDAEPTKIRPAYARFEVAEPPVNLSIIQSSEAKGPADASSHFGIQVKSTETVGAMRQRLESVGLATRIEDSVNCCHAVQDKIWILDPDGHRWEVFVVLDDAPTGKTDSDNECCPTTLDEVCCTVGSEPCCSENA